MVTTTITDIDEFKALDPFFRIIEKGLDGIADGGHFFDLLAEDVVFDYIITVPGYPRRVRGRKAVAELYRPYGTTIVLDRCHDLAVHHDIKTGVVVLEYASEGRVVSTGAAYANRYISVITITRSQGHTLAGLPRPRGGLRRARMAATLMDSDDIDSGAPGDAELPG
jgi:ketosteroid isomerase-like protein